MTCHSDSSAVSVSVGSSDIGGDGATMVDFHRVVGRDNAMPSTSVANVWCTSSTVGSDADAVVVWASRIPVRNVVWPLFGGITRSSGRGNTSVDGNNTSESSDDSGATSDSFSFATYGGENVTILPDAGFWVSNGPVFAVDNVTVVIGGVVAHVYGTDPVTGGLVVQLPPYDLVCGNGSKCHGTGGYLPVSIRNPPNIAVRRGVGDQGNVCTVVC